MCEPYAMDCSYEQQSSSSSTELVLYNRRQRVPQNADLSQLIGLTPTDFVEQVIFPLAARLTQENVAVTERVDMADSHAYDRILISRRAPTAVVHQLPHGKVRIQSLDEQDYPQVDRTDPTMQPLVDPFVQTYLKYGLPQFRVVDVVVERYIPLTSQPQQWYAVSLRLWSYGIAQLYNYVGGDDGNWQRHPSDDRHPMLKVHACFVPLTDDLDVTHLQQLCRRFLQEFGIPQMPFSLKALAVWSICVDSGSTMTVIMRGPTDEERAALEYNRSRRPYEIPRAGMHAEYLERQHQLSTTLVSQGVLTPEEAAELAALQPPSTRLCEHIRFANMMNVVQESGGAISFEALVATTPLQPEFLVETQTGRGRSEDMHTMQTVLVQGVV